MAPRAYGGGSIYQRGDGMWIASLALPNAADGSRRRATKSALTEHAARTHLLAMRRALVRDGDLRTSAPTVTAWLDAYFTAAERDGHLRATTLRSHRASARNYIIPAIGKTRLDKLTPQHVRRVHELVLDRGKSSTTALQAHNVLSGALKAAVYDGIIRDNPATRTRRPRPAHYEASVLTAEQAVHLLTWAGGDPWHLTRWSLALLAGVRQSEALGLTWDDVDLDAGLIRVHRQLQRVMTGTPHQSLGAEHLSGQYWLVPPKSAKGRREVPMVGPLARVMAARLDQMALTGERFIVAGPAGGHLDHSKDRKRWVDALKAAGLPAVRLHDARHTTGTLLRAAGVESRVIQVILGHNSAAMTEHYAHLGDREAVDAMHKFEALLTTARKGIEG